jgi:hypothetical protein
MVRFRRWASSSPLKPPTSIPSIESIPEVGLSSAPIRLSSVDFPEPEGPMIATNSPGQISKLTPRSTCNDCSPMM